MASLQEFEVVSKLEPAPPLSSSWEIRNFNLLFNSINSSVNQTFDFDDTALTLRLVSRAFPQISIIVMTDEDPQRAHDCASKKLLTKLLLGSERNSNSNELFEHRFEFDFGTMRYDETTNKWSQWYVFLLPQVCESIQDLSMRVNIYCDRVMKINISPKAPLNSTLIRAIPNPCARTKYTRPVSYQDSYCKSNWSISESCATSMKNTDLSITDDKMDIKAKDDLQWECRTMSRECNFCSLGEDLPVKKPLIKVQESNEIKKKQPIRYVRHIRNVMSKRALKSAMNCQRDAVFSDVASQSLISADNLAEMMRTCSTIQETQNERSMESQSVGSFSWASQDSMFESACSSDWENYCDDEVIVYESSEESAAINWDEVEMAVERDGIEESNLETAIDEDENNLTQETCNSDSDSSVCSCSCSDFCSNCASSTPSTQSDSSDESDEEVESTQADSDEDVEIEPVVIDGEVSSPLLNYLQGALKRREAEYDALLAQQRFFDAIQERQQMHKLLKEINAEKIALLKAQVPDNAHREYLQNKKELAELMKVYGEEMQAKRYFDVYKTSVKMTKLETLISVYELAHKN